MSRDLITTPTAIVHDWFQNYHGSERVVEVMRKELFAPAHPARLFTFYAAKDLLPPELTRAIVKECRLANLPGLRQHGASPGWWRYLLPYMPFYFSRLPLQQFDLVISSSHTLAVNVRPRKDAVHVCYCHTPMRYAWMTGSAPGSRGGAAEIALRAMSRWLQRVDHAAAQRPDSYVANSEAVRERIQRYYGRTSTVIHPPVEVQEFDPFAPKRAGHFLWVHRLVSHKQPELMIEAFRGLPYKLTMVGVGRLESNIRATLPSNVELLGWLPRNELVQRFCQASGFVHVGEEDFGISMVEALAAGTPVLALDRGGARDIVRPGRDGQLLHDANVDAIRQGIEELASSSWDPGALASRAREFSRERFTERFRAHLATLGI